MKIVQILPGSGDRFYCENCVRDMALVRALQKAGHEVVVAPLYLPRFLDALDGVADGPVFYGGINAYLQQNFGFFRKTPRWIDRLLDARPLLHLAASRAGSVRAADLGEMTLSVLKGADGNQAKELERLLRWLEEKGRPDVVHLSSPLLLGIGTAVKERLGAPIVCSMQDEDTWIDAMTEPQRTQCWEAMAAGARRVDAFVAVSRSFADLMRDRLRIEPERLHVVHIGVDPASYAPSAPPPVPTIGYLARLSEKQGLGLLVEAFLALKRTDGLRNLRLHLSGGMTDDDEPFLEELWKRFAAEKVDDDVQVFERFELSDRKEFLASLSVLSVPTPQGVAFGTFLLEAMAAGVPVVEPRVGSFPEILEAAGGGALYAPGDAGALARTLGELLSDPDRRAALGRKGRQAVEGRFSLESMARNMIDVYRAAAGAKALAAEGRPHARP